MEDVSTCQNTQSQFFSDFYHVWFSLKYFKNSSWGTFVPHVHYGGLNNFKIIQIHVFSARCNNHRFYNKYYLFFRLEKAGFNSNFIMSTTLSVNFYKLYKNLGCMYNTKRNCKFFACAIYNESFLCQNHL
jgi:hypothetical protein